MPPSDQFIIWSNVVLLHLHAYYFLEWIGLSLRAPLVVKLWSWLSLDSVIDLIIHHFTVSKVIWKQARMLRIQQMFLSSRVRILLRLLSFLIEIQFLPWTSLVFMVHSYIFTALFISIILLKFLLGAVAFFISLPRSGIQQNLIVLTNESTLLSCSFHSYLLILLLLLHLPILWLLRAKWWNV